MAEEGSALDALLPDVYQELRRLAGRAMRGERPDHTLQPTALVHEAYLKLSQIHGLTANNRPQFLSLAARVMRQVLVDHGRARRAGKRGEGAVRVTLSEGVAVDEPAAGFDLLSLDQALERLEKIDRQQVRIFELRFLAGLTVEEAADVLDIPAIRIKRETAMARAWLFRELKAGAPDGAAETPPDRRGTRGKR
jgi:RNA polymerase sigma factor (TIGR02999 family)